LTGEEEGEGKLVVIQYFDSPELLIGIWDEDVGDSLLELLVGVGEEDVGVVLLASPNLFAEIKVFAVEQAKIVDLISVKVYWRHNGLAVNVLEKFNNQYLHPWKGCSYHFST
jgi:hypothetical protein